MYKNAETRSLSGPPLSPGREDLVHPAAVLPAARRAGVHAGAPARPGARRGRAGAPLRARAGAEAAGGVGRDRSRLPGTRTAEFGLAPEPRLSEGAAGAHSELPLHRRHHSQTGTAGGQGIRTPFLSAPHSLSAVLSRRQRAPQEDLALGLFTPQSRHCAQPKQLPTVPAGLHLQGPGHARQSRLSGARQVRRRPRRFQDVALQLLARPGLQGLAGTRPAARTEARGPHRPPGRPPDLKDLHGPVTLPPTHLLLDSSQTTA